MQGKRTATLPIMVLAMTSLVMAARQSGVYHASSTGQTPGFVVDPAWPQPLPNNWLLGQIGGLYVDPHDHIWIYNRPRTMTNEEAGPGRAGAGRCRSKGPAGQRTWPSAHLWLHRRLLQGCSIRAGVRYRRKPAACLGRPGRPWLL